MLSFSVIIPFYNTDKKYFEPCIESLLAQTITDIEIIIVDDGSKDEFAKICDEYALKDLRVRVIHQENSGVSAARNAGIAAAQAEYIMFVDADDWIEPDACEFLKKELEGNKCDILMFNAYKEFENRRKIIHTDIENSATYNTEKVEDRESLYHRAMSPQSTAGVLNSTVYFSWDKVYRRSFLVDNGIDYPVGIAKSEDKIFILKCFEKLSVLCYVDKILYHYRQNEESICHRFSSDADADRTKMAEKLYEVAARMNSEIAELKGEPGYSKIIKDYYRFIFGIISDVLFLQYFHKDNPDGIKKRIADAKRFIKTEPFKTAIKNCSYKELSVVAKLKKFMLGCGLVHEFYVIFELYRKVTGKG